MKCDWTLRNLVFSSNLTESYYKFYSFLHPWKGTAFSKVTTIKNQIVGCSKDEGYVPKDQKER